MPDQEPITKEFLVDVLSQFEHRFESKLERLEERLDERFEAKLQRLKQDLDEGIGEKIEAMETKLLTAFHEWARPMESRVRSYTTLVIGIDERVALIEERLSRLELKRP